MSGSKVKLTSISPVTSNHRPIPYQFCPVPSQLLFDNSLTLEQRGFLCVLLAHSRPQKDGYIVYPGTKRLAEICKCSERKIERLCQSLQKKKSPPSKAGNGKSSQDKDFILRKRRLGSSSLTQLAFMAEFDTVSPLPTALSGTTPTGMAGELDVEELDV